MGGRGSGGGRSGGGGGASSQQDHEVRLRSLNDIYQEKYSQMTDSELNRALTIAINKEKTMVSCVQLDGFDAGKNFVFRIECFVDPEKPDDIYFGEIIRKD